MKSIIIFIMFLQMHFVFAGLSGVTKVTGTVLNYDQHSVTLRFGKQKFEVPRKSIKSSSRLKTGQKVTAVFSAEEIMEKISEQRKPVSANDGVIEK